MANRYWVGGTSTWDATANTKWALTSGGAGGQAVPTTADAVFFDAASGANTVTISNGTAVCLTLTCTGFTGTLAFGTNKITIAGNAATVFTQSTTMSVTGTPVIDLSYAGAVSSRTISVSNVTEANAISFNIIAGADIFAHTNVAGIKNLNFTGFSGSWSNTSLNLYGNLIVSTGMTVTAGTVTRTFTATSGTQQITTNGKTLDFPITQNSPGATVQLQDNLTMGSTRFFVLTAGALDLNNKTLSIGLFNSTNINVRSIAFGTQNITVTGSGTSIWNTDNQTNFTYTGSGDVNFSYAGATGTRNVFCGGSSGLITNSINVNVTAGTDTFALQGSRFYKNVNLTGFAGSFTVTNYTIFGSLTLSSGATPSATANGPIFAATSPVTITTAGKTLDFPVTFRGVGGTWAFQDALTQGSTRAFTLTNGTVKLKDSVTSTVGSFVTSGTSQKFLQSTTLGTQATLSQASGTVNASYLTIQDNAAIGGAEWDAYVNQSNIDAGNVDGWNFGISPVIGGAEYTYALRSFTQSRRF